MIAIVKDAYANNQTQKYAAIANNLSDVHKAIPTHGRMSGEKTHFCNHTLYHAIGIIFTTPFHLPKYDDDLFMNLLQKALRKGHYEDYRGPRKAAEVRHLKVEINRRMAALQSTIDDTNRNQNLKTIAAYQSYCDHFGWEAEDGLLLIAAMLIVAIATLTAVVLLQQPRRYTKPITRPLRLRPRQRSVAKGSISPIVEGKA